MGGSASPVSRVRSGATHRSTLVTAWKVRVTGIEFTQDYPVRQDGDNRPKGKNMDDVSYPKIRENFKGWGLGPYLLGWDWEGADNPKRFACYRRQKPISMKVRLRASHKAPGARSFTLRVEPKVTNGGPTPLTTGSAKVNWPADSLEQIVEITVGGTLPNEIARYDLHLTWSVQEIAVSGPDGTLGGVGGVIDRTRHVIYSVYEDPLNPAVSNKSGKKWWVDTGLTRQRLEKLLQAFGGGNKRFPTPAQADIDQLIWHLHKHVNDSSPPYFNGARGVRVEYGRGGPQLDYLDQWVMWLESRTWNRPPARQPHWNYGACITYIQLMKTMLGIAGINVQRAWVFPKTTLWPNGIDVEWDNEDLVDVEDVDRGDRDDVERYKSRETKEQTWPFMRNGIAYNATVRLIDRPKANGAPLYEAFEGCLYYGGKFLPGAISTRRYPADLLKNRTGFANATEVLRWWTSVQHGGVKRFMAWASESPPGFFDSQGDYYTSPYDIPVSRHLPVP